MFAGFRFADGLPFTPKAILDHDIIFNFQTTLKKN